MSHHVKRGEIDRDNNPVGEAKVLATFDDRASAQAFIEGETARFDHNGFVPDGHQAGWWGRNDRDPFEKFHFWIEEDAASAAGASDPSAAAGEGKLPGDPQYRGLP